MDESEYSVKVARAFQHLMVGLDLIDPDLVDVETTGDMITVTSSRGEKCVVNTQRAVHQIWVAGQGQGVHFNFDASHHDWRDDKGKGLELTAFVADSVHAISGVRPKF